MVMALSFHFFKEKVASSEEREAEIATFFMKDFGVFFKFGKDILQYGAQSNRKFDSVIQHSLPVLHS